MDLPGGYKLRHAVCLMPDVAERLRQTIVHLGCNALAFFQGGCAFNFLVQVGLFDGDADLLSNRL